MVYHILFIHLNRFDGWINPSIHDGHLGSFPLVGYYEEAFKYKSLGGHTLLVFLTVYLGLKLLGQMITVCFIFGDTAIGFHSGCADLHSHQQKCEGPISPLPC